MQRGLLRHSRVRFTLYGMIALCVLIIASSLWSGAKRGDIDWPSLVPWFAILGFWVALPAWLMPRTGVRAQQKFHGGTRWLMLDDESVRSGCDTCSLRIEWAKVRKAVETRDFLFAFISGNCAVWIPKRVLSDAELGRVRAVIREKLGKRAKLLAA